jgi:hypothetical protein
MAGSFQGSQSAASAKTFAAGLNPVQSASLVNMTKTKAYQKGLSGPLGGLYQAWFPAMMTQYKGSKILGG